MNHYLMIKCLHIISSVLLVGTGFGSAFYLYFVNRSKNVTAIAEVSRLVVLADWCFTTPAVIIQPLSGLVLLHLGGWDLDSTWVQISITLYLIAGLCWLPVVWLQIEMRDMAIAAATARSKLSERYWRFTKYWERLGYPAFICMLAIFYLMVNKPLFS